MVTPGAGCSHPPLSDATGQTLDTPIDFAFSPRLNPSNTVVAYSSVRRILKRRGGRNFRKFEKNKEFSPIFCPKLGEEQKNRSSLKFSPII